MVRENTNMGGVLEKSVLVNMILLVLLGQFARVLFFRTSQRYHNFFLSFSFSAR